LTFTGRAAEYALVNGLARIEPYSYKDCKDAVKCHNMPV
jgi:hypothetical protein